MNGLESVRTGLTLKGYLEAAYLQDISFCILREFN